MQNTFQIIGSANIVYFFMSLYVIIIDSIDDENMNSS